jgi:hypothetical protein
MADKNKNNYIWIGIAVVAVIVLAIVFISNSNNNSQNEVTCNPPYIKVGTSCCLDQNSNGVCDSDEQIEEQSNVWEFSSFSVDGGTSEDFTGCSTTSPGLKVYNNFNNLRDTSSENIEMALFHQYAGEPEGYGRQNENYQTAVLVVYTDYNTGFYDSYEGVTCEVEEYYDGNFNEVNTNKFKHNFGLPEDKYGFFVELLYSQNDKPSEAKYIISCKGDESGKEVKRTFRFNIDYVDEVVVSQC